MTLLPDHVRICDDVVIEAGRVFEGHELVTKERVISNRCGSFMYSQIEYDAPVVITGPFGNFEVPAHEFDEDMIDDFMWGDDKLEAYIVEPSQGDEMEEPGF